jgi:DNA mismatch repair protein MutL
MGKIVILDENTANQIAAGEVIERPASIVKEMVENALDANATAITVDIASGGIKSIRITDNGDGMEADDVELAFERHATSKIRKIEDLNQLSTMGFRGEALASIASVAKVEVVTKTETATSGIKAVIEAGNVLAVEPAGAPKGTTFTVRELFYNTPARYKFLKKDTTEAGYIQDILTRIALARSDVSFRLLSQGRALMHTPGNHDLLSTIYSLYGKEIAHAVVPVNASGEGVEVSGYVGKPEISRGNRSFQSILVNGRFVYNRVITAALEEAYKTRLMQKRFPFAVLKLSLSPWFVDVNVHPSKLEVRFSDDQKVFRTVYHAVSEALDGNASFRAMEDTDSASYSAGTNMIRQPSRQANLQATQPAGPSAPVNRLSGWTPGNIGAPAGKNQNQVQSNTARTGPGGGQTQANPFSIWPAPSDRLFHPTITGQQTQVFEADGKEMKMQAASGQAVQEVGSGSPYMMEGSRTTDIPVKGSPETAALKNGSQEAAIGGEDSVEISAPEKEDRDAAVAANSRERLLRARIIGQAFESYILLEDGDEMLLIDQHAAHERIRYEKLKQQFIHREAFGQGLLSPLAVTLSELEMDRFHELSEYLNKLGFDAEVFGTRSILIRAIPYVLDSGFSGQDFLEILEKLSSEATPASEIIPDETLYMMACKSAIKANRNMSTMEIRGLVEQLADAENPYTCVHGRPVIISMTKKELEKRFKRIV